MPSSSGCRRPNERFRCRVVRYSCRAQLLSCGLRAVGCVAKLDVSFWKWTRDGAQRIPFRSSSVWSCVDTSNCFCVQGAFEATDIYRCIQGAFEANFFCRHPPVLQGSLRQTTPGSRQHQVPDCRATAEARRSNRCCDEAPPPPKQHGNTGNGCWFRNIDLRRWAYLSPKQARIRPSHTPIVPASAPLAGTAQRMAGVREASSRARVSPQVLAIHRRSRGRESDLQARFIDNGCWFQRPVASERGFHRYSDERQSGCVFVRSILSKEYHSDCDGFTKPATRVTTHPGIGDALEEFT